MPASTASDGGAGARGHAEIGARAIVQRRDTVTTGAPNVPIGGDAQSAAVAYGSYASLPPGDS